MRVTGGIYRSRQVRCPPGDIRPSMDRMRQSLFQILGALSGCRFLDLFRGGTGVCDANFHLDRTEIGERLSPQFAYAQETGGQEQEHQ